MNELKSRRWSTVTRLTVVAIVLILIVLFIAEIQPLLAPLIIACLLAYVLNLSVGLIERRTRLSRKWAVNLIYITFILLLIAAPGTLVPLAVRLVQTISTEQQQILEQVEAFMATPLVIYGRTIPLDEFWADLTSMSTGMDFAFEGALTVLETTTTSFLRLLIIAVTSYYLLLDWHGLRRWLVNLVPEGGRYDFERLMAELDQIWRVYLRGTLALMLIMAVFFIIIGLALGLPGAVALGLATGFLSMIPELGPWIAGALSTMVAFILGSNHLPISNFWFAVLIAAIYLVVMQIKSLWLRPQVMGRFMRINTGLVFLAIIAAAMLQGILAALIVLPILATIGVLGRYVRARLLNIDPWPNQISGEDASQEGVPEINDSEKD